MQKKSNIIARIIFLLLLSYPLYAAVNVFINLYSSKTEQVKTLSHFKPVNDLVNSASDTHYQFGSADLELSMSVNPTNPSVGSTATFYMSVTNNGPDAIESAGINALLPSGFAYVGQSLGSNSAYYDEISGVWKVVGLKSGDVAEIKIDAKINNCDTFIAEIFTSSEPDPDSTPSNGVTTEDDYATSGKGCSGGDKGADLGIEKTVDNPLAAPGTTTAFILTLTNYGPTDASNIHVYDVLPAGVTFVGYGTSSGTSTYDALTGLWYIPTLANGAQEVLKIEVEVGKECPITNKVFIKGANEVDSNAANDTSEAVINNCESSGGGTGGMESNGRLARLVATRNFNNLQNEAKGIVAATPAFNAQYRMSTANKHASVASIMELVPTTGPLNSTSVVSTPSDLIGITNATGVFSVDYLNAQQRRLAVVLATTTPDASTYEHTKVVCDRLNGASLEEITQVSVQNRNFLMTQLRHPNSETDYSISFVVYQQGNTFYVDSQFRREQYKPITTGAEVLNFQVWSVVPQFTKDMVAQILTSLAKQGKVEVAPNQAPTIPAVYIRSGHYEQGKLMLNLVNTTGATSISLNGTQARTETEARAAFSRTVTIPATRTSTVEVPVGNLFDLGFSVTTANNANSDELYVADGSWGSSADDSKITTFNVSAPKTAALANSFVIDRDLEMAGSVKTSVAAFRFLQAGAYATNLSAYNSLRFDAKGSGTVKIVLEKAGITTWDHYATTITLTPETKSVEIPFSAFRRSNGQAGLTAEDLTQVVFYVNGNGQTETAFNLNVSNMAFVKHSSVATESNEQPKAIELSQNFPNPFNPSTAIQFNLPSASNVKVTVFDMMGRSIAVLANGNFSAGAHSLNFDATALPSGTYFYRLEAAGQNMTKKMTLLK
jgi:uncharacterized repeat protein (TIGR01451 family)